MKYLKTTILAFGYLFLLLGLVWIGQGTGYFPYPKTSFMIDQTPWAYRGAGLFVLGLVVLFGSSRIKV